MTGTFFFVLKMVHQMVYPAEKSFFFTYFIV